MTQTADEIAAFLAWFRWNADRVLSGPSKSATQAELDRRLGALGITVWEAGPYDRSGETSFLALSPQTTTDRGAANRTRLLKEEAPSGWLLLRAKPPKHWDRVLLWGRAKVRIDANGWRFHVYKYPDGIFDIVMCSSVPEIADEDQLLKLVLLVLESEVGEGVLDELVNAVKVLPSEGLPTDHPSVAIGDIRKLLQ